MDNIIELSNIYFSYRENGNPTPVLSDINLSIAPREFISLIGPHGCGKSTLLSLICGLMMPTKGRITKNCSHIGYMQQRERFFEWRSLYHNIIMGLENTAEKNTEQYNEHEAYISNMMKACGLKKYRDMSPDKVPGNMKKKAALIRTLAMEPELVLMDDVFSTLDYEVRIKLHDEMRTLLKKEERTVMLATHDISEAICFSDRVAVLTPEGTIQTIVSISLNPSDNPNEDIRKSPAFCQYFNEIWRNLNMSGQ